MAIVDERYAEAILSVAYKNGKIVEFANELETTNEVASHVGKLTFILDNPEIDLKKKILLVIDIFESFSFDSLYVNFLKILVENNRFSRVSGILKEYIKLAKKNYSMLSITIETAKELTKEQIEEIEAKCKKDFKVSSIRSQVILNEELIGGVKIVSGNTVIDRSLRKQLNDIEALLRDFEV